MSTAVPSYGGDKKVMYKKIAMHTEHMYHWRRSVGTICRFEAGLLKNSAAVMDVLLSRRTIVRKFIRKNLFMIFRISQRKCAGTGKQSHAADCSFKPEFTLPGERVEILDRQENSSFIVTTNEGTTVRYGHWCCCGLGCFEPANPLLSVWKILKEKVFPIW